jgi:3-phosphoshikimate 1-carboxyvinyltransferase
MVQSLVVSAGKAFTGIIRVPGDKSISHRALLFGALADGETTIDGFLSSQDTQATAGCLRAMGVTIEDGAVFTGKCTMLQHLSSQVPEDEADTEV